MSRHKKYEKNTVFLHVFSKGTLCTMTLSSLNFLYKRGRDWPVFFASCKHGFGTGFSLIFGGFWGSKNSAKRWQNWKFSWNVKKNGFRAQRDSPGRS